MSEALDAIARLYAQIDAYLAEYPEDREPLERSPEYIGLMSRLRALQQREADALTAAHQERYAQLLKGSEAIERADALLAQTKAKTGR